MRSDKLHTLTGVLRPAEPIRAAVLPAVARISGSMATGGGTMNHARLNNRNLPDQHPIEAITGLSEKLGEKFDDAELDEQGRIWFLSGGERVSGPLGPFGTGGGSANAAKLTVTNTTGWLFTTVAAGQACWISLRWSSLLDGLSTGKGKLRVYVGNALKTTLSVEQGDVSVDVSNWLAAGDNTVQLEISDAYGNNQTLNFSVEAVAASVSSTFDGKIVYRGPISYYYTPFGAVEKTVYFLLDGEQIGVQTVTLSGQQQDFIIPAQPHGSHSFDVFFTAQIGEAQIESNHLYYDLICTEEGRTETIIASSFRPAAVEQYDTLTIPYRVYDPTSLTASVVLAENGETVQELTVDRTEHRWSHRLDSVGEADLTITSGDAVKRFAIPVTESVVTAKPVTNNLILDLSSYGRSNLEVNPLSWESNGIACQFSGFNLKSDGWILDEDGVTVMRVGGDARLRIPMKLFAADARTTGKTIELEFATRAVRNYEATIVSCMDGGRGLEVTSQMAAMASAQSSLNTQYKEDEHIRLSFVIEKRTGAKLMMVYLNGICSGAVAYPDDDDFSQQNAVEVSIGSSECTIDLYHIRVYNADLTRHQILLNWIADTQLGAMKKARFARNDVYDAYGNVVIDKLPKDLPYLVLTAGSLPQFKGDKKKVSGYYVDPVNPDRSFRFADAEIDVQGTSSQYYKVKNYKIKFKGGFILADGTVVTTYAMNDDAIPVMVFCMKADVASSEGANNVVSAKIFNRLSPKMPAQEADPRVRNTIDGHPIVIFWDSGGGPVFLGKYNFNNDKSTNEVFGLAAGDESWECKQNGTRGTAMKEANFEGDAWEQDWEARFPDGNKDTTRLNAFVSWVASTNSEEATGAALSEPVTYGDTTYTHDTAEYRLAKFPNEIDRWAHKKQSIAYYLYTLIILAIDQREKNTFPTYIAAVMLWFWLYYDGDSIMGTNNKGALAFSPFLLDTDYTESGDPVFNGAAHVFWTNLRLCFWDEIEAMYQEWSTQGLLSYEIMRDAFDEHQSKWPEAIFNEDMYKKCLEAWIEDGDGSYLPMLLGKKELQRAWWLFFRFRFMDSMFVTGTSMENRIIIRAHEQSDVSLKAIVPIFGNVFYNALRVSIRMEEVGRAYVFPWEASGAEDTVIGINDADLLTDLGDLSGLMVETIDLSKAKNLVRLKLGDGSDGYSNRNLLALTLGNNPLLQTVDVRNCPNLTQSVDMSGCTGLEEAYFDGTSISGLTLPNGGVLKKLHLPASLTNLTVINQPQLAEFEMPSFANLTTLRLESAGVLGGMALGILAQMPANSRVRVLGIAYEAADGAELADFLARLDSMRGLDESGNNVDTAQVSGSVHVAVLSYETYKNLASIRAKYPDLAITYDTVSAKSVEILDGTLAGDYRNDTAESICQSNVLQCRSYCKSWTFTKVKTVASYAMANNFACAVGKIDLHAVTSIGKQAFAAVNCGTYIIRTPDQVCANGGSVFRGTPKIYVPAALLDSYKAATNWSAIADNIYAIEDYPDICGGE
ncbi:MAG: hypothetical protein J6L24_03125 [Oscillospiraceae bacterium]|nr:hypothetical protein [Oscillospiraceae bacterium]